MVHEGSVGVRELAVDDRLYVGVEPLLECLTRRARLHVVFPHVFGRGELETENAVEALTELADRGRDCVTRDANMQVPVQVVVIVEIAPHKRLARIAVGEQLLVEPHQLGPIFGRNEIRCHS